MFFFSSEWKFAPGFLFFPFFFTPLSSIDLHFPLDAPVLSPLLQLFFSQSSWFHLALSCICHTFFENLLYVKVSF